MLCSYQMGNVNELVISVTVDKDGNAVDFRVDDDGGGEMSAPVFECQGCHTYLDLSDIRTKGEVK